MSQFPHESTRAMRAGARTGRALFPVAWLLVSAALGCFDPKITSGNLKCAPPDNACPDGFLCSGGVCVSKPDGAVMDSMAVTDLSRDLACANAVAPLCLGSVTAGAACDPVCQTGCGCGLRCTVSTAGAGCTTQIGSKALGQVCSPTTDDCAPGLACLREACGRNLGRCYRFCRDAGACGAGVACATQVNSSSDMSLGQLVCDLGPQACDPIAGIGCPDPALSCFVTATGQTLCDCPGRARREGENCQAYDDCAAGLACLQGSCVRLCRSTADCSGCAALGAIRYCPMGING